MAKIDFSLQSYKVSIITATYNSSNTIYETYLSLLNQTYTNWEWLVTDDCSTDNTLCILTEISSADKRVKIFKNQFNSGAAVSRNKSLKQVTGGFIAFIDSDDLWTPYKLEGQILFMQSLKIDFCFTPFELIDGNGKPTGRNVDFNNKHSFSYKDMLSKRATLGCSTVVLRVKSGGLIQMPHLRTGQDYATWLSILKEGQRAYLYNYIGTKYRILPNSISRNKIKKSFRQWEIYRDIERLSFMKSCYYFINYAYRAIFRR